MKSTDYINKFKRGIILVMGVVVALFLLSVNVDINQQITAQDISVSEDLDESDRQSAEIFKLDPTAINTISQINLVHEFHVIWEVLLPEKVEEHCENHTPKLSEALSRILFERIISPNAP